MASMNLLLHFAKGFALEAKSKIIDIEHFKLAVKSVELENNFAAKELCRELGIEFVQKKCMEAQLLHLARNAASAPDMRITPRVSIIAYQFLNAGSIYRIPALLYRDKALSDFGPDTGAEGGLDNVPYIRAEKEGLESGPSSHIADHRRLIEKLEAETAVSKPSAHKTKRKQVNSPADLKTLNDSQDGRKVVDDALRLAEEVREYIGKRLFGQDQVIDALADGLVEQSFQSKQTGPAATLLLVGPPATGKSYTADLLGEALGLPLKLINMSSMQGANQAFALTGMSAGYADSTPGELTSFVRENPRCVVVLDHFDKAHPNIQNVLLPMFDKGFITDQCGFFPQNDKTKPKIGDDDVDFRYAIVVFTTNAASQTLMNPDLQMYLEKNPLQIRDTLLKVLSKETQETREGTVPAISPGLLSRLSSELLLLYKPLKLDAHQQIARRAWADRVELIQATYSLPIETKSLDTLIDMAILGFGADLDARKSSGKPLLNRLLGRFFDYLQRTEGNKPPSGIRYVFADTFIETFAHMLSKLDASDALREIYRRQWFLQVEETEQIVDGWLQIGFANPKWSTASQADDFFGSGAVQVRIPNVRFDDIAGMSKVKSKLHEIIQLLQSPDRLLELGVSMPRGLLLYGPPGTGKTMLAKAFANEAELPFIATTGPEILDPEVLRQVFERARRYAPSLLFIDEVDVVGSRDNQGSVLAINQLLAEIDGFGSHAGGVFIVAATNYPERIDKAILRSGRIDIHCSVDVLDAPARHYFFKKIQKLPGGDTLDIEELVRVSSGMSGAQLEQVRRELGLSMVRNSSPAITHQQTAEQLMVTRYGERRSINAATNELEHVAYHEAGHAVVALTLDPDRPIEQITIVPRGRFGGFVSFSQDAQHRSLTRKEVLEKMAIGLAGRASQQKQFGDDGIDEGAASDLQTVTELAHHAVTVWGLDERIGSVRLSETDYRVAGGTPFALSNPMVLERVQDWVKKAELLATEVLNKNWESVGKIAMALLEVETLSGIAAEKILSN